MAELKKKQRLNQLLYEFYNTNALIVSSGKSYETTKELVDALKSGETDAIFVDMYLPTKRADLFNGTWFEVKQFVKVDISHGIVLRGEVMKMHKTLKDFIAQNNVQSNYLSSGDENKVGKNNFYCNSMRKTINRFQTNYHGERGILLLDHPLLLHSIYLKELCHDILSFLQSAKSPSN